MACHHDNIRAPVFKPYQHTHAYFMHAGGSHTVKSVDTPFENRLHASGMIIAVCGLAICFLKAHNPVKSAMHEPFIVTLLHRHDLYCEIVEIRTRHMQHFLEIVDTVQRRKFT